MPKPACEVVIERCCELAAISDMTGSTFRTFLSPAMKRCYEKVSEWMASAGMSINVDAAGNLRGLRRGIVPGKLVLLLGSHLDTVREAGAFDGILGVVLAISALEAYKDRSLPFDIEVIGFSEEEGVRFALPFIGSRALVGLVDEHVLKLTDAAGISIAQAIRNFGLDPGSIAAAKLTTPALGFVEFHIEQGPVLDEAGESVAIVEAIAGQSRASVKFLGAANHAGTTPMRLRHDALAGAAEWIGAVEQLAGAGQGLVATAGKIDARPNVANVIPGEVTVTLDVRHAEDAARDRACGELRSSANEIAHKRGLDMHWTDLLDQKSVRLSETLTRSLEAAGPKGMRRMVSGAGHDAMILAPHIPSAMLFLRSPGGVSHHPSENVLPEDVDVALSVAYGLIEAMSIEYNLA